jgi:hypothetical protein
VMRPLENGGGIAHCSQVYRVAIHISGGLKEIYVALDANASGTRIDETQSPLKSFLPSVTFAPSVWSSLFNEVSSTK